MNFVIIEDSGRYILYIRTQQTYEIISAVDGKEEIITALRRFCKKFRSKKRMEDYMKSYKSYNTRQGMICLKTVGKILLLLLLILHFQRYLFLPRQNANFSW